MLTPAYLNKSRDAKLALLFVLSAILLLAPSCNFISNRILVKPVVQVEAFQLSAQDFSKELALKLKDLDALTVKDSKIVSFFKEQILNDFIVSAFINLWFAENKLALPHSEVDAAVAAIVSTYPTDTEFRELLSQSGLSFSAWVVKIEQNLKKKKLLAILTKDVLLKKEELLSYYNASPRKFEQTEAVLLSHILVRDPSQIEVVKKLLVKQNFTEVAKKYSSAFNAEAKDRYGWIERGYLPNAPTDKPSEFEKSFKLSPGDIFGPIALPDGLHLFKIAEKRAYKLNSFKEVQERVRLEVIALRETAKFTSWLDVQIKKYKVKKNQSMIDSIRIETR